MAVDDLLATYSGLGTKDGDKYYKGEECLACVKDLIRFLRDDELVSSRVRRHLGQAKILQRDLLPILIHFHQEKVLRNDVLKLMLNLTLPAHIVYGNELRDRKGDVAALKCYSEVESYLREYKEAFASAEKSIAVLVNILGEHLKEEWHSREEEDSIAVERVLVILRNILHTPVAPSEEKRTDDDCNLHDQLIWNLHSNACHQILLYLSSSPGERSLCLTVMEILFLLFRQSSPEDLVRSSQKQAYNMPNKDSDILANLVETEMHRKKQAVQLTGTRHSRFGGTYEVFSDKSISSNNRIHHANISSINTFSYDANKRPRRKAKKFRPIEDDPSTRASISSVRKAMGELALGILEHSYNTFMKSVKGRLAGDIEATFEDHYDTYYLWGIRFFMEFNRLYSFRLDLVRETLDVSTFNYLMKQIYCYQESLALEKEEQEKWGKRLHRSVSALKELFHYVQAMQCSEQNIYRENARILQSNIFYTSEFREMFPSLLRQFKPAAQTRTYLATLADTLHLFIRLLEKFSQSGSLMVQKKGKTQRKKAPKKRVVELEEPTKEQLEIEWESLQFELLRLLESDSLGRDDIIIEGLFDATRPDEEDDQRQEAVSRTQACLRRGDMERGVATLRAAREIWPRDDFGPRDATCLEELQRLKLMYFQPIAATAVTEDVELDEEFEGNLSPVPEQKREGEFDLFPYLLKFCHHKVIQTLSFLLSHYNSNSDFTNHALVKLLHRVCYQCKKLPLLYQISLFSVFQQILDHSNSARLKELKVFASHILKHFFSAARYNPCLFVEVLFWKTQDDCVDIELGYGTVDAMRKSTVSQRAWSEEDVTRLSSLWDQYKGCEAVLNEISAELSTKNEKQIKNKLISLGLAEKGDFLVAKKSRRRKWTEEEDQRLRELHSVYGEQEERIDCIASHFDGKSRSEVAARISQLGIGTEGQSGEETVQSANNKQKRTRRKKKKLTPQPHLTSEPNGKTNKSRPPLSSAVPLYATVRAEDGLATALGWIENCLRREGADRGMDPDWDDVPIVPTNLELGQAIESSVFQDMMRSLSLTEPDVGQMFWRIPSELSPRHLNTCADLLSGKSPDIPKQAENNLSSESSLDLSEIEDSSCSQPSTDGIATQAIFSSDITQSLKQKRPGLARLLESKKSPTDQSNLNREQFYESSPCSNRSELNSSLSLSSPTSHMKPSVRKLYNSDSESDTSVHEETNSVPLHSKLQRLRAALSDDSDLEPDHLAEREEVEGGRAKRSRLDSGDSQDEHSSQQMDRYMKKVRYIHESEDDED